MFDHKRPFQTGRFQLADSREVLGELTLDGPNSGLRLHDRDYFEVRNLPEGYLSGVLLTRERVSLHNCISAGTGHSGRVGGEAEQFSFAHIFPNYVLIGDRNVTPSDKTISAVEIDIDDASTLFYEFGTFGTIHRNCVDELKSALQKWHQSVGIDDEIEVRENAQIAYWTGKHRIVEVETEIGKLTAFNSVASNMGSASGAYFRNKIVIRLDFEVFTDFATCRDRIGQLLWFLNLLIGRAQSLRAMRIELGGSHEARLIDVYWSHAPNPERDQGERTPSPAEALIWASKYPEVFSIVARQWFATNMERRVPRGNVIQTLGSNSFDSDRLVRAANAFDHLPDVLVADPNLSEDIMFAHDEARRIFKKLPESWERQSILNALGRIRKPSLRHIIKANAELITVELPNRFPDLDLIVDEAVRARNYYVHGENSSKLKFDADFGTTQFLTVALEFIFCFSELIKCGWSLKWWKDTEPDLKHPLGAFWYSYRNGLARLRQKLDECDG